MHVHGYAMRGYIDNCSFRVLIQPLSNDSGPPQPSSSLATSRNFRAAALEVCLLDLTLYYCFPYRAS